MNNTIDTTYMLETLRRLLDIPSPTGFTDEVVRFTTGELERMGVNVELTRRGGIRADFPGKVSQPNRSIVAHLDNIGAMVKTLKDNGRLEIVPIGTWSSRFCEGARVTIFTDERAYRGTVLPVKASGHIYDKEIDLLPVSWHNLELRIDEPVYGKQDLLELGINVGDFVAVDPGLEVSESGYLNARHLDDKAGVAVLLAVAKQVTQNNLALPVDCHLLFTISEEVGSGASSILHRDVAEMVTVDTGPVAPGQSEHEQGIIICSQDSSGPFDYHLTRKLTALCKEHHIPFRRDVFTYYRCDSAAAVEAGNDIRTALVCFATDATHGYERTHMKALEALGRLLLQYMRSAPTAERDEHEMGPIEDFTTLPVVKRSAAR